MHKKTANIVEHISRIQTVWLKIVFICFHQFCEWTIASLSPSEQCHGMVGNRSCDLSQSLAGRRTAQGFAGYKQLKGNGWRGIAPIRSKQRKHLGKGSFENMVQLFTNSITIRAWAGSVPMVFPTWSTFGGSVPRVKMSCGMLNFPTQCHDAIWKGWLVISDWLRYFRASVMQHHSLVQGSGPELLEDGQVLASWQLEYVEWPSEAHGN